MQGIQIGLMMTKHVTKINSVKLLLSMSINKIVNYNIF